MQTITLTMIVRDEAEFLPACLESVVGAVDEIVVLDTGSTDGTERIATSAGAKLHRFRWEDDFAAARNAALAHCTSDWVLVLDADERLATGVAEHLRGAVEATDVDCIMLPLHNARSLDAQEVEILSGAARLGTPTLLPRLLRRTTDLRWRGRVHESVATWLAAREGRVGAADIPIVHYGSVPSFRSQKGKDDRNRRLLQWQCDEEPENISAHVYYANELMKRGDVDRARAVVEHAWSLRQQRWLIR